MKVAFRVDASLRIGSGHVMRCLTLAQEMSERGADVIFVCREHRGNLIELVRNSGFPVHQLAIESHFDGGDLGPQGRSPWLGATQEVDATETIDAIRSRWVVADWVIVDHYDLDAGWETAMRSVVRAVMVIDDLADRRHDCDVLLDQNHYDNARSRYQGKISTDCRLLLGPSYALLRREFRAARAAVSHRSGSVKKVFISFGGVDPGNETCKAIEAFSSIPGPALSAHVVAGAHNPHHMEIERLCRMDPRLRWDRHVGDMSRCMIEADLSIGAGGATTWERCCVGLPAIVIAIAANQEPIAEALSRRGACWYLGPASNVCALDIARGIELCAQDPTAMRQASRVSMEMSPGDGTDRVWAVMSQHGRLST